jgi:kynurenine formamidase
VLANDGQTCGHPHLALLGLESETYILQKGRYQIEVMANLDKVPATGALIVVTWPKVKDGLGFPARAFAILP